jgi:hypothetical protein
VPSLRFDADEDQFAEPAASFDMLPSILTVTLARLVSFAFPLIENEPEFSAAPSVGLVIETVGLVVSTVTVLAALTFAPAESSAVALIVCLPSEMPVAAKVQFLVPVASEGWALPILTVTLAKFVPVAVPFTVKELESRIAPAFGFLITIVGAVMVVEALVVELVTLLVDCALAKCATDTEPNAANTIVAAIATAMATATF